MLPGAVPGSSFDDSSQLVGWHVEQSSDQMPHSTLPGSCTVVVQQDDLPTDTHANASAGRLRDERNCRRDHDHRDSRWGGEAAAGDEPVSATRAGEVGWDSLIGVNPAGRAARGELGRQLTHGALSPRRDAGVTAARACQPSRQESPVDTIQQPPEREEMSPTPLMEEMRVRARWVRAMWFAAQEAKRRREKMLKILSFESARRRNSREAASRRGVVWALRQVAESQLLAIAVGVSTLWILYGMDIYFLTDPPVSLDTAMYGVSFAGFAVLSVDFVLGTWLREGYANTFYFWLDFIAILSVIPDVIWLFSPQHNTAWTQQVGFLTIARAARAARASTSASKVIRLVPKVKKFLRKFTRKPAGRRESVGENALQRTGRKRRSSIRFQGEMPLYDASGEETQQEEEELQSKIGKDLDAIVSTHMILVVGTQFVLSIVLSLLFEASRLHDIDTQLHMLAIAHHACPAAASLPPSACAPFADMLAVFQAEQHQAGTPLLFLSLGGEALVGSQDATAGLRQYPQEFLERRTTLGGAGGACELHLEDKRALRNSLVDNMLTITAVISVLVAASMSLAASIRWQAVVPMERMIATIQELAVNPLKPLAAVSEQDSNTDNETQLVEQALVKFGSLLQLGFGEAGAKIISGNIKNGKVDATLPGKVTQAIFGFCDIRNFTDCTEVLQGDVVKLVNGIAQYVHEATKDNFGAPNKNIGDAFLLVWKPKGSLSLSFVAASALRSYIRTIISISSCSNLSSICCHPKLQERIPGFKVRMGFGLHYGWAIEGAIGSQEKIDASYLSPHVNIASRLEACTKQYGVSILISQHLHSLLPDDIKPLCRLVDRVTLKGSLVPMFLYTYDVPEVLADDPREKWQVRGVHVTSAEMELETFFFMAAPPAVSAEFSELWERTLKLYLGGPDGATADWPQAADLARKCLQMKARDGPALTLLEVLTTECGEGGAAPADWAGYRSLKEK